MATERVGTQIRRARERKQWKQERLADELGVSRATVVNWETHRTKPKNRTGAIEEILGIKLDFSDTRALPRVVRDHIERTMPDPVDQQRVIGMMEGTVTWPGEDGAAEGHSESPPQEG